MEFKKNFDIKDDRNLTMLVDFYELTMGNGYLNKMWEIKQPILICFLEGFLTTVATA